MNVYYNFKINQIQMQINIINATLFSVHFCNKKLKIKNECCVIFRNIVFIMYFNLC